MASKKQIRGALAALEAIAPRAQKAGLSQSSAERFVKALCRDLETNIAPRLENRDLPAKRQTALSLSHLASLVPYDRASFARGVRGWSEPSKAIASQFAFAQASRIAPPPSDQKAPTALLIDTVASRFGDNASGSNVYHDEDGNPKRGLIVPVLLTSAEPVPVAIEAPAEDIEDVGFSKQIVKTIEALRECVADPASSPDFRGPPSPAANENKTSRPSQWRELPQTLLVPASPVGGQVLGTGAPRTVNADAATLRELVAPRGTSGSKESGRATGDDCETAKPHDLPDRIVIEIEEPLREVDYLDPVTVGKMLGWRVHQPLFKSLVIKGDAMFYAVERVDGRTLLHRVLGKLPPQWMTTMGGRRTAFELIGFDLEQVEARTMNRPLADAIAWCEVICQRQMLVGEWLQEGLGDTLMPAWVEATGPPSREWVHNARLMEYLALMHPQPFF